MTSSSSSSLLLGDGNGNKNPTIKMWALQKCSTPKPSWCCGLWYLTGCVKNMIWFDMIWKKCYHGLIWYEMVICFNIIFTTQWKCDDRSKGASQIRKGDKGALLRLRRPPDIVQKYWWLFWRKKISGSYKNWKLLDENGLSENSTGENSKRENWVKKSAAKKLD